MDHQMQFRVLGPLEIMADGRPVNVASKPRAILAILLIHANEVVSTDQLLDAVWGEEQPSGGPRTLTFHIRKLRGGGGPADVIATKVPGYVLEESPARVDALVFESLLAEARDVQANDPAGALKLLDEALSLWRGTAYAVPFLSNSHLLAIQFSGPGIILTTDTEELIQIARDRVTIEFDWEDCQAYGIEDCPAQPELEEEEPDED